MLRKLILELEKNSNPRKAEFLSRFFKTGKGQYGEGDVFLGITVPEQRKIAKRFPALELEFIGKLLSSKINEERLVALLILVEQYKKSDPKNRDLIACFYLKNAKKINNWDLVD